MIRVICSILDWSFLKMGLGKMEWWTRKTDGGEKTTKCSFPWTCGGKEKQWEKEEDLDVKCQGRPARENTDLTRIARTGNGQSNERYGHDITNYQMISNDQNTNYHGTRMTPRNAQLKVISWDKRRRRSDPGERNIPLHTSSSYYVILFMWPIAYDQQRVHVEVGLGFYKEEGYWKRSRHLCTSRRFTPL